MSRHDPREHVSLEDMSLDELRAFAADYGFKIPAPIKTKPAALAAIIAPLTWPERPVTGDAPGRLLASGFNQW